MKWKVQVSSEHTYIQIDGFVNQIVDSENGDILRISKFCQFYRYESNITNPFFNFGLKFYSLILRRPLDLLVPSGVHKRSMLLLDLNDLIEFGCILCFHLAQLKGSRKCASSRET